MKIDQWMKTDLVTIPMETTLEDAINLLVAKKVGTLPVVAADGKLLGLVTMKGILKNFLPDFYSLIDNIDFIQDFGALELPSRERQSLMKKPITEIMNADPHSISPEHSILSAIGMMSRHHLNDLLVVRQGVLVGLVSTVDLGAAFLHWIRENAELCAGDDESCQP